MGYSRNPFWEWENDVSSATVGVLMAIIITGAAILLTLLLSLLQELWRIYRTHVQENPYSPTGRVLVGALLVFLAVVVLSFVVGIATGAWVLATYVIAWSFLLFVVVVEIVDHTASVLPAATAGDGLALGERVA